MSAIQCLRSFFVPNQRISKKTISILACIQAAAALALWAASPVKLLPSPGEVLGAFSTLWYQDGLARDLWISFSLNLEVVILTVVVSLFLSYLTVMPFFRPPAWLYSKGRFSSLVGLTFAFTLFTSGPHQLKVVIMVFIMSVFFVTSMYDAVAGTLQNDLDYGRVLYKGEWGVVWEVIVLGKIDLAFDILRQVAAMGWAVLTMVEGYARSEGGVGILLLNSNKYLHLDKVFAIQLCILGIGIAQDYAIGWLKDTICPYAAIEKERQ